MLYSSRNSAAIQGIAWGGEKCRGLQRGWIQGRNGGCCGARNRLSVIRLGADVVIVLFDAAWRACLIGESAQRDRWVRWLSAAPHLFPLADHCVGLVNRTDRCGQVSEELLEQISNLPMTDGLRDLQVMRSSR